MESKLFIRALICLLITSCSKSIYAQEFKSIESQLGLSFLKDNTGVAVADYDGDYDLDIFVVSKEKDGDNIEEMSQLFRNNNDGTYTNVTAEAGLLNLHPFEDSHQTDPFNVIDYVYQEYKRGVSWGDYDNDGDPDLFFSNSYRVLLYKNLGNGTFADVTDVAGFNGFNRCFNTSALWFDYNNDGYLDMYISDYNSSCGKNSLFRNNTDGTFTETSNLFTSDRQGSLFTFMSLPIDVNNDGWLDLYLANDFGRNDLYINQNGTRFLEQSVQFGLDDNSTGMAFSVGDYDNNGLFDIYVSNIDGNSLFTNTGNNKYTNDANQMGVYDADWAWASRFADFDLDGDEDLFVANGQKILNLLSSRNNNVYYKNLLKEGQSGFSNISNEIGVDDFSFSICTEVFDYDNDGDLDMLITNKDDSHPFFYENTTIDLNKEQEVHWLKVMLQGTISNKDAIGARVSIVTNNGTYHRYYHGASLYAQSLQPVHFGVGSDAEILELKITWPLGLVETYNNLSADATILATEGQGIQVLDIEPSTKVIGCTDANSCNYSPFAIIDDGSCQYLDSKEVSGNTNSFYLQTETYTYPPSQDTQIEWEVEGGEIIEKADNSITVKWGLQETGKIIAVEFNECKSLPSVLEVSLKAPITSFNSNHSVARLWNEALLEAIRGDYARPTIHARNLFHSSVAMYDAWAIYDQEAKPYLLGNELNGYNSLFEGFALTEGEGKEDARKKTISYAVYRLLSHRFKNSPSAEETQDRFDLLMHSLGYDLTITSDDYSSGDAAAMGNYIAKTIIEYGFVDGSRESNDYDNAYYSPVNPPLAPEVPGNNNIVDPNRWQPLSLDIFIDQSGNVIVGDTPDFLNPEWGNVVPFSLTDEVKTINSRSGNDYSVYYDPGAPPPSLNTNSNTASSENYKWGFSLVSIWGSHLDPTDNVMWDISPKSIGNIDKNLFPTKYEDYPNFYNTLEGGDIGLGHAINPVTNAAYETQMVPRGDYARVLAEFWADGPDSETPPGHWFTLLNYVSDHPLFQKKLGGKGDVLDNLEWDVKAYFTLGGTMHDAAIAAWSIKGWYDYIRPISAIRFMANQGQSTDETKANYNISGIPLKEGYIEIVEEGDPLEGRLQEHIGKIKLYTWRGHNHIGNPSVDQAGVGWILAENWWPYQRPSFVTPPFAGFVSGHSTFSRAAAEVMTLLTGDAYFPGGYGEFVAKKNEFLVFEEGPSMDIKLQWATYRDASDQCSLSRIWGGIHPPADDIYGRLIGEELGVKAFNFAETYFEGKEKASIILADMKLFPNPVEYPSKITITNTNSNDEFSLFDIHGRNVNILPLFDENNYTTKISLEFLAAGLYLLKNNKGHGWKIIVK